MKISEIPAMKMFLLATIVGISFAFIDVNYIITIVGTSLFVILGGILFFFKKKDLAYYSAVIALGILCSSRIHYFEEIQPDKIIPDEFGVFQGEIVQMMSTKENYLRYIAEGNLNPQNLNEIKNTRVLITIFNPKYALIPGDKILSNVKIHFFEADIDPDGYSLKKFMKSSDINFSISTSGYNISKQTKVNSIRQISFGLRKRIVEQIFKIFDEKTASVMSALIVGDKSFIPKDVNENFKLSGTAHLLAVSGLHVGIISFIIFTFLGFIRNDVAKAIITILLLLFYVFVIGFLTSGVRAALMISVYLISQCLERKINHFNSLGLAALVMFLISPDVIFSVSFQLSVGAVTGILFFYNLIKSKFDAILSKVKFSSFISSSFSITLASSIVVSPIIAIYFDTFSSISPIANLIVVPIMVLAMSFGIISLLLSFISQDMSYYHALSGDLLVSIADQLNSFFVSFSFSYYSGEISIIIALSFSVLLLYLITSNNLRVMSFRIAVVFLCIILISNFKMKKAENEMKIVPKKNFTAVLLRNSNKNYLLLFDRKPANEKSGDFEITNFIMNNNIASVSYTGNSGISTIDKVKKEKKFDYFEMKLDIQEKIINLLKLKEHPSKIIHFYYD